MISLLPKQEQQFGGLVAKQKQRMQLFLLPVVKVRLQQWLEKEERLQELCLLLQLEWKRNWLQFFFLKGSGVPVFGAT